MKDPYLIKGVPCWVWENGEYPLRTVAIFKRYYKNIHNEKVFSCPLFVSFFDERGTPWENYKPIGTEWDFAPDWALDPKNKDACSTVDSDGAIKFWDKDGFIINENEGRFYHKEYDMEVPQFICPDKTRYEGDNWKTSLRTRPVWAGGEGER